MSRADLSDECVIDKTGRRLSDMFCGEAVALVFSSPVCVCVCWSRWCAGCEEAPDPSVIGSQGKSDLTEGID